MLDTVLAEESAAASQRDGGVTKRPIIVTAFGVHDASYQLQVKEGNIKDWYRDQMPQGVLKQDGFRAAALNACLNATSRFVQAAAPAAIRVEAEADGPPQPQKKKGSGQVLDHERGGRRMWDSGRQHVRHRRLRRRQKAAAAPVESGNPGRGGAGSISGNKRRRTSGSSSATGGGADGSTRQESRHSPPLVFVLQNNGYYDDPGDVQQTFLEEVRRIQRREIGIGLSDSERAGPAAAPTGRAAQGGGGGGGGVSATGEARAGYGGRDDGAGVFLVDDSASLYRKLSCYRITPSSHYHEPVKIVEGKMLWDLFALVDREEGSAAAATAGEKAGKRSPAAATAGDQRCEGSPAAATVGGNFDLGDRGKTFLFFLPIGLAFFVLKRRCLRRTNGVA